MMDASYLTGCRHRHAELSGNGEQLPYRIGVVWMQQGHVHHELWHVFDDPFFQGPDVFRHFHPARPDQPVRCSIRIKPDRRC